MLSVLIVSYFSFLFNIRIRIRTNLYIKIRIRQMRIFMNSVISLLFIIHTATWYETCVYVRARVRMCVWSYSPTAAGLHGEVDRQCRLRRPEECMTRRCLRRPRRRQCWSRVRSRSCVWSLSALPCIRFILHTLFVTHYFLKCSAFLFWLLGSSEFKKGERWWRRPPPHWPENFFYKLLFPV